MNDRRVPRWPIPALLVGGIVLLWSGSVHAGVEVEIEGVEGPELENVRAFLGIVQHDFRNDAEINPRIVRRLHKRAPEQIREALKPFGYHEAEVDAHLESDQEGDWTARYRIRPGPPVLLTEVEIQLAGDGVDDPGFTKVLDSIELEQGQRLNHQRYETAKERLMEVAAERGYLEARWREKVLRVDPGRREATATLMLDTGPRYAFGRVRFEDTVLSEAFLRRYLQFHSGDPFDSRKLLDLQFALDDSDYFRRVHVRARRDLAANRRIPVDVELQARPKHRYSFGGGFGTDTGPRASVSRETRYTNDRGHSLNVEVQVAQISSRLGARYVIPLEEPWRERLELDTAFQSEEIGDGETDRFELGAKRVTVSGGWQRSLSLRFERSEDRIAGETTTRDLVLPGIGFGRSRFDSSVYATRGYRVSLNVDGGSETLGSDVSFLRARASGKGVRGLWDGARVIGRLELGRIWVDEIDDVPLSQRFFAGGDQSVRGFDFEDLGPRNEDGDVVGGRFLIVSSIELEQLLVGNWGAAVFVDHGNAVNDLDDQLRTSAGIGLRYRSPVGMVRVDVAKAVDGDESARLHLSLGVNL